MKNFFLFLTFLVLSSLSADQPTQEESHRRAPGYLFYSIEGGALEIYSEKDLTGKTVYLLKCCNKNTGVELEDLLVNECDEYLLKIVMYVNKENTGFGSFIHEQHLDITVDPVLVKEITLEGKVIKSINKRKAVILRENFKE